MLTINEPTWQRLRHALEVAQRRLPQPARAIFQAVVVRQKILRDCRGDEGMLAQWERQAQGVVWNGPAIAGLSPDALFALVCHEAAHVMLDYRNLPQSEEAVCELACRMGADMTALFAETGKGTYPRRAG